MAKAKSGSSVKPRKKTVGKEPGASTGNHDLSTTVPGAAPADGPARTPATREPTHEEIRRRAYEIFQQRGGHHGRDHDDWLQAEKELRQRRA